MPTLCPRDGTELTTRPDVLGPGAPAAVCPTCTGVLLDWEAAKRLAQSLGLAVEDLHALVARAAKSSRPTPPPACTACGRGPMKPLVVQGTELDLCEACGATWLDRSELSRITRGALGANLAPQPPPGEVSSVEGVYEMWWDCGHCEATGLLGKAQRYCPRCGAPQDASKRYFPPAGQETPAGAEYLGADVTCPACGSPNGARAAHCGHCGSPLASADEVARAADRSSAAPRTAAPASATPAATPQRRRLWPYVLGLVAVASCGVCGAALFWTREVPMTVTAHTWSRELDVERLEAVREDAWCDALPAGAHAVTRSRQQRSTKRVANGEECSTRDVDRGDGTFERRRECRPTYRDEPVYDDRCTFTVERWRTQRSEVAKGRGLTPLPHWPEARLGHAGCATLGCERAGSRRERYDLELQGPDGKPYRCTVPQERWLRVADGTKRALPVGVLTGHPECAGL